MAPQPQQERYVGKVTKQLGNSKFFVSCPEVSAQFDGVDPKITWKSNPPDLKEGDTITFSVVEEYPGNDWGSPMCVDIEKGAAFAPGKRARPVTSPASMHTGIPGGKIGAASSVSWGAPAVPQPGMRTLKPPPSAAGLTPSGIAAARGLWRTSGTGSILRKARGIDDKEPLQGEDLEPARLPTRPVAQPGDALEGEVGDEPEAFDPEEPPPEEQLLEGGVEEMPLEDAEAFPVIEPREDGKYVGLVSKSMAGKKFFVRCPEVAAQWEGVDTKVTWKSNAPDIAVGDWIAFKVVEEFPGSDWGSPLAMDVELVPPPENFEPADVVKPTEIMAQEPAERPRTGGIIKPLTKPAPTEEQPTQQALFETLADGRYLGKIHKQLGNSKYFIACPEASAQLGGVDVKVTWKSNSPPGLSVGDWITFSIVPEYPGTEWGSPLAVDIELMPVDPNAPPERPQQIAVEDEQLAELLAPEAGASASVASVYAVPPTNLEEFQRRFWEFPAELLSNEDREAMLNYRKEIDVSVEGDADCTMPPVMTFDELREVMPNFLMSNLQEMRVEAPEPTQAQALPLILGGENLAVVTKTGKGKTLAHLLPAIVHVEAQEPTAAGRPALPIALVLQPTKEAVKSTAQVAARLVKGSASGQHQPRGICAVGIAEGDAAFTVQNQLRGGCELLFSTPQRLLDATRLGDISLERVTYLVIDDTSTCLQKGMGAALQGIINATRADRHALLFTNNWTAQVRSLAEKMFGGAVSLILRGP